MAQPAVAELARLLASIAVEQTNGPTVELIVVDQSPDGAVLSLLESEGLAFPPASSRSKQDRFRRRFRTSR